MALTAIAANVCLIAGYVFYLTQALPLNSAALMKDVYLTVPVVYAFLFMFSLLARRATGKKMSACLAVLSPALFVFVMLFFTALFIKIELPSPHNFTLRKMELILGICYTACIFFMAALLLWQLKKPVTTGKIRADRVFFYLLVFFFIFNCALSLWFGRANEPTGDEPAYILVAHSMMHDHDIDLRNNYENGDFKNFYSRDLQPQGNNLNVNGKMYPKHPLLFSALIAPFYMLAGVAGISILMCFFSALLAAILFYLCFRINNDMEASITAALLTGFTMPVIMFINLASTDILCGLIPAAAYVFYRFRPERVLVFAFIMAAAVWIHLRIAPVYASIALLFLIKHRGKPLDILKFGLVQLLSFAAFFGINYFFYKDFIPYSSHQTQGMQFGTYFLRGIFVYFFDRQAGLFSYAPFYIICLPGIYFLYKRSREIAAEFALILIPYYIVIASYPDWGWGSSSARYLMAVIFIFTVAAAEAISAVKSKAAKNIFHILSAASIGIGFIVAAVPWFRWDRAGHENWLVYLLSKFSRIDFTIIFPSLINMNGTTVYAMFFWIIVATVITAVFICEKKP